MTGVEPVLPPMRRYTTGEVCSILGIHRNTLRRKTVEGSIRCMYRRSGSRMFPYFLGKDIMRFWRAVL